MFLAKKLNNGAGSPAALDAQFNYVTMLLHGDGTNGAQNNTFIDSSTNAFTITRNGNTTQGSFSPYGSNWSNYFDGTGDYLTAPSNSAFAMGTGDFTIECWVYTPLVNANNDVIIELRSSGGTSTGFVFNMNPTGVGYQLNFYTDGGFNLGSTVLYYNVWNHCAVTRSGTTVRLFANGIVDATFTKANNFSDTPVPHIGVSPLYSPSDFEGYFSNLRVVKGTALYTSNFTPSTVPLTAISGTSLLTCQSNRFIDNSTNNFTITVTGTPSVQRFNPFGASTAYSTSVIGGSGYFDGTGDSLSIASASALNIGSADMTMEFWMLIPSAFASNYRVVFAKGNNASGGNSYAFEGMGSGDLTLWVNTDGGSGWNLFAGTTIGTPTVGAWNHVVLCRSGTTWYSFMNGTRVLNTTGAGTVTASSTAVTIGDFSTGGFEYTGYVSNLRLVNGTAVYANATTCTVPTTPLTAVTNTQLLTNFTNGAIFDNAMMNNLETVGNAQISTSVKKYGTGSMYFDGNGDNLAIPTSPNLNMSTGNFTVECWVYISSRTLNYPLIFSNNNSGYGAGALAITNSNNDSPSYYDKFILAAYDANSSAPTLVASSTNSSNTWYHLALVRNGTSLVMYRDGTSVASATISSGLVFDWGKLGSRIGGGNWDGAQSYFNGYIDDLRITKGYARYTANFTAPTAALPDIGPI